MVIFGDKIPFSSLITPSSSKHKKKAANQVRRYFSEIVDISCKKTNLSIKYKIINQNLYIYIERNAFFGRNQTFCGISL